ncbi:uncharacterized protein EI90DRAFT_3082596 [Cantharellus anzutake]|uniref:uncharacterized protein n=1 Tax=Cantharellus anzutake TaxID=1750568 RepID=UPI0019072509|nr:uncharacterized protein EI90DRAFT_3082596 [Cantharellus anzutake]KAF8318894.1 hypothetical protein EI90DRAFT_3082596 [Cantharellus anzutake]
MNKPLLGAERFLERAHLDDTCHLDPNSIPTTNECEFTLVTLPFHVLFFPFSHFYYHLPCRSPNCYLLVTYYSVHSSVLVQLWSSGPAVRQIGVERERTLREAHGLTKGVHLAFSNPHPKIFIPSSSHPWVLLWYLIINLERNVYKAATQR